MRQYQEEIEKLRKELEARSNQKNLESFKSVNHISPEEELLINRNISSRSEILDAKRDKLILEYQDEMKRLRSLHENEKHEKEIVLRQIEAIKAEYKENIQQINLDVEDKQKKDSCNESEILKRIEILKAAMIGGEKAYDQELSERRRRKKVAAERRAR